MENFLQRRQRYGFTMQLGFCQFHQLRGAKQLDLAIGSETGDQLMGISTLYGTAGSQQAHHTIGGQAGSRLDGRHHTDNREGKAFTQGRQGDRTGRVTSDDDYRQRMPLLHRADNLQHALNNKLFGFLAVGKRHIIEGVYIVEVRQQLPNLLIHR
ncbi:hypothetical protein D3C72_1009720 [compost metagenome]